ncbi:ER membrane protein complex subunit 2 [Phytophthora citrophthora]|uniref:ER membrane protein complex subunit 2 n=1 Tax=Phytophthora citrophthora TaxID=4793 RepID=A0AAD9G1E0_9STRA|nr:ER membrane protein complex subunit 2 [Phytophthora citrophthora]
MGSEFEHKLAEAERSGARDKCVELLHYVRKEKLREPRAVASIGKLLTTKHSWGLGDELWSVYEQTFVAALDLHDDELAETCLKTLQTKFPSSSRVARLEGMQLEQRGEFAKALALYDELLEANPANALVLKRKIAMLKAQKKTADVITALNEFLRSFGTDQAAWTELGETYLSMAAYRYAAFCYEELVLLNPMDAISHSRLADVYSTIGGLDNLLTARKHYAHSLELNKKQNLRAYFALVTCTKAIAAQRGYRADQDDDGINERLQKFALDYIQDFYAANSSPELAEIAQAAITAL